MSTAAEQKNRAENVLGIIAEHIKEMIVATVDRMNDPEFAELRKKVESENQNPDMDVRAMAMTPEDLFRITMLNSLGEITSRISSLVHSRNGDISEVTDRVIKIACAIDESLTGKFAAMDVKSDIDTSHHIVVQGSNAIN